MRFRRFLCSVLSFALLMGLVIPVGAAAEPPAITASSAAVYHLGSGAAVYEKNADQKSFPTALVKIMTALLVFEKCPDLFAETTVTPAALQGVEGTSNAGLKAGEVMTVKNLLYCMIVRSANDAAQALAIQVSGDVASFVALMNQRAAELGMASTCFTNPTGLHDPAMVTTARDMIALLKHVAKSPALVELFNTPYKRIPATNLTTNDRNYASANHLISEATYSDYFYRYAAGIMAGSTADGGYCLATISTANGQSYLCVVLGSDKNSETKKINSFVDAKKLLEFVHGNYDVLTLAEESTPIREVPVALAGGRDYVVLAPVSTCAYLMPTTATLETVEQVIKLQENITAPIEKGQVLGTLTFVYEGKEYGTIPLAAQSAVERSTFLYVLDKIHSFFTSLWVRLFLAVLVFLIVLYIILSVYVNRKRKNKKHMAEKRYVKTR